MARVILKSIIKKYWKILLSILIISAIGCAIMTGLSSTQISLKDTLDTYLRDYNYPDAQITVYTTDSEEIRNKIFEQDNIKEVYTRLSFTSILISPSNEYCSSIIYSYDENDFQKFYIWESTEDSKEYDNIYLEYKFAKTNNIPVGSIIKFKVNGEYRDYHVSKLVSSPETLYMSGTSNQFVQMSNFGTGYFSKELLRKESDKKVEQKKVEIQEKEKEYNKKVEEAEKIKKTNPKEYKNLQKELKLEKEDLDYLKESLQDAGGYENYYNQFLINYKGDNKEEELKKTLEVFKEVELEVTNSFTYETSSLKQFLDDVCIKSFETMANYMPLVFFVVIVIVVYLFLSYMIQQSRKEIGILRAIGVSTLKIGLSYCLTTFILSIGAILLGIVLGLCIMTFTCIGGKNYFPLPFFNYLFNFKMFSIAAIITIIIIQLATIVAMLRITSIEPGESISYTEQKDTKVPLLLRVINLKPSTKFFTISFLRNKLKVIFTMLCVAVTIILIYTSLCFSVSKDNILDEIYKRRINYDAQVFFEYEVYDELLEEMKELDYVDSVELLPYYDVEIVNEKNNKKEKTVINAKNKDSNSVYIYNENNEKINVEDKGIVLEQHLADALEVKKGDIVKVNDIELKVTDISYQTAYRLQYISYEQAQDFEHKSYETIIVNLNKEKKEDFIKYLSEQEDYLYTSFTDESYVFNQASFEIYDTSVFITIMNAVIIGLLIVINTTVINLQASKRKICMFRSLGLTKGEISRNMFIQALVQYILACLIGFPLAIEFAKHSLHRLSVFNQEFIYVSRINEFVITGVIVFSYILISHLMAMRAINNWSLSENIKGRE